MPIAGHFFAGQIQGFDPQPIFKDEGNNQENNVLKY